MKRNALIISIFIIFSANADNKRLKRELDFILGKQEKAPIIPKVITYDNWKNSKKKVETDEDGMIIDSTSTSLAAPVRKKKKVIINLQNKKDKSFKGTRKRSR